MPSGPGHPEMAATEHRDHTDQRGQRDGERIGADAGDAECPEHDTADDACATVGCHDDAVRRETAVPGTDAASQVGGRVGHEADDERGRDDPVALEEVLRDVSGGHADHEHHERCQRDGEGNDPADDREPALAQAVAVRNCPAELLLERQEEPRGQEERREPEAADRLEALLAEGLHTDLEERVAAHPGDEQADSDRQGAFGQREALGRRQLVVAFGQDSPG